MKRSICIALLSLVVTSLSPIVANAAGAEYERHGHDIILKVDARWAGNANGGYYPIRIRVTNRGLPRNLTFRIRSDSHREIPTVTKSLSIRQNETIQFTLSVPMVSDGTYATLDVIDGSRRLTELAQTVSFPDTDYGESRRPALLVISSVNVDCDPFETAVTATLAELARTSSYRYYASRTEDHQVVSPGMLPDSWIDYSGLDFVALNLDTLAVLSPERRAAITKWVTQGGTLLVYDVGTPPEQSKRLNDLPGLSERSSSDAGWVKADTKERRIIVVEEEVEETIISSTPEETKSAPGTSAKRDGEFVWSGGDETFAYRDVMNGRVYSFQDNPFPGSPHDWAWFLKTAEPDRYEWTRRQGISARRGNHEFLQFLIPGVEGVPVYSFLFLITIFSIVIGPVNYFVLLRRKQLYMLILTIPIIAFLTSASLFAYSAVAHGFGTKSRVRSVTWLDQKTQTAVTTSRVALYSGLAPSNGLQFSPETAVFSIWPSDRGFSGGTVDWSDTQSFRSGWLRSRTRTQFLTTTIRDERGRLNVESQGNDSLKVANGLEWSVEQLLVADENGKLFAGGRVKAGGDLQLKPATTADYQLFSSAVSQHRLELPQGIDGRSSVSMFNGPYSGRYSGYDVEQRPFRHSRSLLGRTLRNFRRRDSQQPELPPNSYAAILSESPDIDLGMQRTSSRASLYVLVGYY